MPIYESAKTDKQNVVLDIGSAYTKIGFSSENSPRCIIKSQIFHKPSGTTRRIFDYKDETDLYDMLVEFLHHVHFKFTLLSPKDRSVVIVESFLTPTLFRETLAKVLFVHYEALSVLWVPSHLVSLSTLAVETALVVDLGYEEAVSIPICHGLPILNAWEALPIGGKAIHNNIKQLLSADNIGIQNIAEETLEDIKVRCCFVTPMKRAEQWATPNPKISPCPEVLYPMEGSKTLKISGKLRETAYEVLYQDDRDHCNLANMILDTILKVNIHLRKPLAENILIIGGTAMAQGFKSRLKDELNKLLKSNEYSGLHVDEFKFFSPPSKDNYTAWLGGAIYGATDLMVLKSLSKSKYLEEKRVPDWANIKDHMNKVEKINTNTVHIP